MECFILANYHRYVLILHIAILRCMGTPQYLSAILLTKEDNLCVFISFLADHLLAKQPIEKSGKYDRVVSIEVGPNLQVCFK